MPENMGPGDPLLSLDEAAAIFGVSNRTIARAIDNGYLPCYRFGARGVRRVKASELAEAMSNREENARKAQSLGGKIGAHRRWAHCDDRAANARAGIDGLLARFEREVDPNGELPPAERAKRAENLKRAHFSELARRSAEVRRRKSVSQ